MRRREFFILGAAAGAFPIVALGQQANSVPKVGFLFPGPEAIAKMRSVLVLDGLRSEGFREPDQVVLVVRATSSDNARLAPLLAELIASKVDIIIPVGGPPAWRTAHTATASIPIIAADLESDPIESGLVASLAHPGGNVTGMFMDFPDFSTTWLELLTEAVPGLASVVVLWDPSTTTFQTKAVAAAAQRLKVKIEVMEVKTPAEFDVVFEAASARRPDGLLMLSSILFSVHSKQIAALTLKHRLPAISMFSSFARAGGLISYGPNIDDLYRKVGVMAGKVLKGAKPGDLPAERPSRFELVVNLQAAKELNLSIPNLLLARADEIIE